MRKASHVNNNLVLTFRVKISLVPISPVGASTSIMNRFGTMLLVVTYGLEVENLAAEAYVASSRDQRTGHISSFWGGLKGAWSAELSFMWFAQLRGGKSKCVPCARLVAA
jgi:hypothetical protein